MGEKEGEIENKEKRYREGRRIVIYFKVGRERLDSKKGTGRDTEESR